MVLSSRPISTRLSDLVTPMRSQKVRMEPGVKPRRRRPAMVGMRGSSQLLTMPSSTSWVSRRLLMTVYSRFRRLNSICRGWQGTETFCTHQS
jgi:hypothetical protein